MTKSRKLRPVDVTGISDLGPEQPIDVPRPPLSLIQTTWSSKALISSCEAGVDSRVLRCVKYDSGRFLIFSHSKGEGFEATAENSEKRN